MANKTIVITGAHSYLGGRVTNHLLNLGDRDIYAFITPWAEKVDNAAKSQRLHYLRADLTQPLISEAISALASADCVLHFAWVRGINLQRTIRVNHDIINSLMDATQSPNHFHFISSVAASPNSLSTYGQAKYQAMQIVGTRGGISLLCGLVVDKEPRGPYMLLTQCVRKFPVRLRFSHGGPQVYPVLLDDVVSAMEQIVRTKLQVGTYKLFKRGIELNVFLRMLENINPKQRFPMFLPADTLIGFAKLLKRAYLAPGLCDRLLTFLHKEVDYLMSQKELPYMTYREVQEEILALS